jgi:hypothetical protein
VFAPSIRSALALILVPCLASAQDVAPVVTTAPRSFDLRAAPARAVGDRTRERLLLAQTGVIVTKFDKEASSVDRLDHDLEFDVLEEVLALAPTGEPERVLRTYERVRSGKRESSFSDRPLLLTRKPSGREALSRPDGAAFDERATRQLEGFREAERAQSQPALDAVVPRLPVAIGDRWTLSPDGVAALVALFDMRLLDPAQVGPEEVLAAEGTLTAVEQKDGLDLLHVDVSLRLSIKDLDEWTFDPPAEFVISVRYVTAAAASPLRSLTFEASFKGTASLGETGMQVSRDLRLVGDRRVEAVERGE